MFAFTEHGKNYLYNLLTKTQQRIIKLKYVANISTYQLNVSRLRPRSHTQHLCTVEKILNLNSTFQQE